MKERELLELFSEALELLIEEHSKDRFKCSGLSTWNKCRLCVLAETFYTWRCTEPEEPEEPEESDS